MRLEQLQYIVEVANQKSISKAAKNLFIAQPSLSKAISQLEAELGVSLFVRLQQGIIPTTAGDRVIAHARGVLAQIEEIKAVAGDQQLAGGSHILRIALPLLLCNDLLNHALHLLRQRCPCLTVLPYQADNAAALQELADGALDLGVISYSSSEKEVMEDAFKSYGIFYQILSREDYYLVASANSPWARRASVAYKELAQVPIATFSDVLKSEMPAVLNEVNYLTSASVYLPSKESLFKLLLDDDHMITIFPRIGALTDSAVCSGELAALPITDFPTTQYICLLLNASKPLHPDAQAFIDIFTELYHQALAGKLTAL